MPTPSVLHSLAHRTPRSRNRKERQKEVALSKYAPLVKYVVDAKYDEILGVHMIGPRATELVAEATVALKLECTVEELIRTIHAHPTMSEAVGEDEDGAEWQ